MKRLTDKQCALLSAIGAGERPGREVRAQMAKDGVKQSRAAFYILADRMEDAGLLKGTMKTKDVDGHLIHFKSYRITAAGQRALNATLDFYGNLGAESV